MTEDEKLIIAMELELRAQQLELDKFRAENERKLQVLEERKAVAAERVAAATEAQKVVAVQSPGPQGERGAEGEPGTDGVDGKQGPQGIPGERGLPGERGTDGIDGASGVPGLAGRDGAQGPSGPTGDTGPQGPKGDGFTWKGEYTSGTAYTPLDVVSFKGSSWVTRVATHARPDLADWELMAERGQDGASGKNGPAIVGPPSFAAVGSTPDPRGATIDGSGNVALQLADASHPGLLSAAGKIKLDAISGANTGDLTLASAGSTPADAGASLAGQVLTLQPADATHPGLMTAADKTKLNAVTGTNTGDVTIGTANGLSLSGQVLSMAAATGSVAGAVTTGTQTITGFKTFTNTLQSSVTGTTSTLSNAAAICKIVGSPANGATAVAIALNAGVSLSTAGAILVSVQNAGIEKFNVDKDGNANFLANMGPRWGGGTASIFYDGANHIVMNVGNSVQANAWANANAGAPNQLNSNRVNAAGAIGTVINTNVTFNIAGEKLLSIQNNTVDVAGVDRNGGLYLGKLTTTAINALTGADLNEGTLVWDSTLHKLKIYTGSAWELVTST